MENLNNISGDDRQSILNKRQAMLEKMGVKNGGKMMNESVVSTNSANSNMAQKLADIRSGKAKAELNKYMKAYANPETAALTNGVAFNAIPEAKRKKDPRANDSVKPEYRQEVEENFNGPPVANSQELNSIEALFGSYSPSKMQVGQGQNYQQQVPIDELDIDSVNGNMPVFNPQAALQKARQKPKAQAQSEYLKYANDTPLIQEEFIDAGNVGQQVNLAAMQIMMETIAKGIAEKTIRKVLNEYTEQQKGKMLFEYYNKAEGIIKTQDGKYYRIKEVILKKKT